MEEKDRKPDKLNKNTKLDWSVPKLLFIDKRKTEGGTTPGGAEDDNYPLDFYS